MAGQHNRGWQVFHGRCDGRSGTFSRGFGRSGFRARLVSGSHAEEKRPTANPLALMYESRLRARGEILFLVRCCLTPMSDRVFSWKTRVVAEASGAEMVLWLNLNFQACLFFFSILVETILKWSLTVWCQQLHWKLNLRHKERNPVSNKMLISNRN